MHIYSIQWPCKMGVLLHFQSQQKWRGWSHCHLWWQRRLGVGHGPVVATNGLGSNGNRTPGRRYRRYIKIPNKDVQTLHFLNGQHDLFCLFCSFRMFTSVPAWGPKAGWQEVQHQISVKANRRVEESKSPRVESTLFTMGASRSMVQHFHTKVGSGLGRLRGCMDCFEVNEDQWPKYAELEGRPLSWTCFAEMSLRCEKNMLCLICAACMIPWCSRKCRAWQRASAFMSNKPSAMSANRCHWVLLDAQKTEAWIIGSASDFHLAIHTPCEGVCGELRPERHTKPYRCAAVCHDVSCVFHALFDRSVLLVWILSSAQWLIFLCSWLDSCSFPGFIHSAGILQDGCAGYDMIRQPILIYIFYIVSTSKNGQDAMLINQTWEKFDAVFEAKSRAAAFLHDAPETELT